MASRILHLYHRMPGWAQSIAATMRGQYLRGWRYGPETGRLVDEALEKEQWSPERWKAWREERLAYVLHRAATRVPYYREQWMARRRRGERASWEDLANWPILEKDAIRECPAAFVADDCKVGQMFHEYTSGSTGKALDLWWSRETVRAWYALFEARCRFWYGVSRADRWAILGGQLVTPVEQRRPPFWVWNAAMNQLYMSTYHLSPDLIAHYLDALQRYRIRYLVGYTSSLHSLAEEALRRNRRDLKLAVAITNAEPVFAHQRQAISEAFQCPVCETYGMAEIAANASECPHARLHQWPESGWVEVVDGEHAVPDGTPGELVCTGLLNADMPLIRYRVGDCGQLPAEPTACACGRTLPYLDGIEGRTHDLLITRDGRRVFYLGASFYGLPVREAQIIQESLERVRVCYVPAPEFSLQSARAIVERLQARLEGIEVVLEPVERVPRGPNGKFHTVVSRVPADQQAMVQRHLTRVA